MSTPLPTLTAAKAQARRLRLALQDDGVAVSHGKSLEMVASQHGFRDWNTLHAAIGNCAPDFPVQVGQTVEGRYLGQPFRAQVLGLRRLNGGTRHRITLRFEKPVNVSKFESMAVHRRQISATINRDGRTAEKTSDGEPHLVLEV